MPIAPETQRAILDAYGAAMQGRPVGVGSSSFWRQYDLPNYASRQVVLERANALVEGASLAAYANNTEGLTSIYENAYYDCRGQRCGPAETTQAEIRVNALFMDPRTGRYTQRTVGFSMGWKGTIGKLWDNILGAVQAFADMYGLELEDPDDPRAAVRTETLMVW